MFGVHHLGTDFVMQFNGDAYNDLGGMLVVFGCGLGHNGCGMSKLMPIKIGRSCMGVDVVCFGIPNVRFSNGSNAFRLLWRWECINAFDMMRSNIVAVSSIAKCSISVLVIVSICKIKSLHCVWVMPWRFSIVVSFGGLPLGFGDCVPGFHLNDSK